MPKEENKVFTKLGALPRSALSVKDITTETDNSRAIATEWYLKEPLELTVDGEQMSFPAGEMVRRSVAVEMLNPPPLFGAQPIPS